MTIHDVKKVVRDWGYSNSSWDYIDDGKIRCFSKEIYDNGYVHPRFSVCYDMDTGIMVTSGIMNRKDGGK